MHTETINIVGTIDDETGEVLTEVVTLSGTDDPEDIFIADMHGDGLFALGLTMIVSAVAERAAREVEQLEQLEQL